MFDHDDFVCMCIDGVRGSQNVCSSLPRVARYVGRDVRFAAYAQVEQHL